MRRNEGLDGGGAPYSTERGDIGMLFLSVWLEIGVIGLATSVASNARLSWEQSPDQCASALARNERAGLLHATCEASESGWARVLRAGLTDALPQANGGGTYRDAPTRGPSATTTRVFEEERSRIRKSRAVGLAGAIAALLCAAALMRAQPVPMTVVALGAIGIAWRLVTNARAATAALVSALHATTRLGAAMAPPPADARPVRDMAPVHVMAPGCFGFAFLGVAAIPIAGALLEAARPVSAHEIGMLVAAHIVFFPLVLAAGVLLRGALVAVDGGRREIRVVRHILGIPYSHTSVPLEIVSRVSAEDKREARGVTNYLVAHTRDGPLRLVSGDDAHTAAAALARALDPPA